VADEKGSDNIVKVELAKSERDATLEVIAFFIQLAEYDAQYKKLKTQRKYAKQKAKYLDKVFDRVKSNTLREKDILTIISLLDKFIYGSKKEKIEGLTHAGYRYRVRDILPYMKTKEKFQDALNIP